MNQKNKYILVNAIAVLQMCLSVFVVWVLIVIILTPIFSTANASETHIGVNYSKYYYDYTIKKSDREGTGVSLSHSFNNHIKARFQHTNAGYTVGNRYGFGLGTGYIEKGFGGGIEIGQWDEMWTGYLSLSMAGAYVGAGLHYNFGPVILGANFYSQETDSYNDVLRVFNSNVYMKYMHVGMVTLEFKI